ncbi:MAG: sulfotransferase family 2 domain-containing protein [Cyanobacteria bacterium J06648_16]
MFFWQGKEFNILFVHPWKSGGSTVKRAFFNAFQALNPGKISELKSQKKLFQASNGELLYEDFYGQLYAIHYTAAEFYRCLGTEEWAKTFKFSIVRNPLLRLLSMYNFSTKDGKSFYKRMFLSGLPYTDEQYLRVAHHVEDLRLAFRELGFKNWLLNSQRMLIGDLCLIPVAKIPQHRWFIGPSGAVDIDKIYRLENLGELSHDFQNRFGLSLQLGHENKKIYEKDLSVFKDPEVQSFLHKYHQVDMDVFDYDDLL